VDQLYERLLPLALIAQRSREKLYITQQRGRMLLIYMRRKLMKKGKIIYPFSKTPDIMYIKN
jgi:hypothetical protein